MLYVIYGTDSHKARKKLHELLDIAKKKRPEAELFKLTSENWSEAELVELLVSKGLFETKYTVVLDSLFEKKDIKSFVVEKIREIGESEQVFLMLESGIDASTLKKIEKHAKQIQEFSKPEGKKTFGSIFTVTDGILEKDKKKLWVSLMDFLYKGTAPEEIHGIFFWQIKNMLLATKAKSQTETGLSPFVYTNALRGARKYKTEELLKMSSELVGMTHKVRSGEGELEIMMEKWVLGI
jgi:DNA polymerase III delta subunit